MKLPALPVSLLMMCCLFFAWLGPSDGRAAEPDTDQAASRLIARAYDSGFDKAHDTYNGMSAASDGRIYYVLCSEEAEVAGQMFVYDPATDRTRHLGDLNEACGEKDLKAVAQGKSHVKFVEREGRLYFATHIGYYSIVDGMETVGIPPAGMKPYPGGHLLAYDMASGKFHDLGIAPRAEGILTMNMDARRGRIYGITWPSGCFFRYDLERKEMKDLGAFSEQGEKGRGPTYRTLCRSIAIDPTDGSAYFTRSTGEILRYDYRSEVVAPVVGDDLKKDYFGQYDITSPGHMAYNWRQVVWYEPDKMIYGVHGNSGYLFRFDPRAVRVEVLDRLTSRPSQRSGMFDQFSYGYLGFELGPDGRTLYYLTGAPIYENGRRVVGKNSTAAGEAKGLEDLHLITYDIPTSTYKDHGAVFFENGQRPTWVNSIAVGKDGAVYSIARITANGRTRADLFRIPPVSLTKP